MCRPSQNLHFTVLVVPHTIIHRSHFQSNISVVMRGFLAYGISEMFLRSSVKAPCLPPPSCFIKSDHQVIQRQQRRTKPERHKCKAATMSNRGRKQQLRTAGSRSTEQQRARRSSDQITDSNRYTSKQKAKIKNWKERAAAKIRSKTKASTCFCVVGVVHVVCGMLWFWLRLFFYFMTLRLLLLLVVLLCVAVVSCWLC